MRRKWYTFILCLFGRHTPNARHNKCYFCSKPIQFDFICPICQCDAKNEWVTVNDLDLPELFKMDIPVFYESEAGKIKERKVCINCAVKHIAKKF